MRKRVPRPNELHLSPFEPALHACVVDSRSSYKVLPAYVSESEAEECQVHHLKWNRGAFLWFFPAGPHVGCGQGAAWMADIRYIYIRYVFACIVL